MTWQLRVILDGICSSCVVWLEDNVAIYSMAQEVNTCVLLSCQSSAQRSNPWLSVRLPSSRHLQSFVCKQNFNLKAGHKLLHKSQAFKDDSAAAWIWIQESEGRNVLIRKSQVQSVLRFSVEKTHPTSDEKRTCNEQRAMSRSIRKFWNTWQMQFKVIVYIRNSSE